MHRFAEQDTVYSKLACIQQYTTTSCPSTKSCCTVQRCSKVDLATQGNTRISKRNNTGLTRQLEKLCQGLGALKWSAWTGLVNTNNYCNAVCATFHYFLFFTGKNLWDKVISWLQFLGIHSSLLLRWAVSLQKESHFLILQQLCSILF